MTTSATLTELIESINTGVKLLEQIKGLFDVHKTLLISRDLDKIEGNNDAMASLLMQLNENFRSRIELQRQLCPELNDANWSAFVATLPPTAQQQLRDAWETLDAALAATQTLSQINQQIVRRSQQQIDELVSILQGKGKTSQVYNQRGSSGHLNTQTTIGKA